MDTVLGVSMAPTTVRVVLVEGENADGVTVDEENFEISPNGEPPLMRASDQVVSAILGTREGAAEAGYQLRSTGVTCRDQVQATALRDALAAHKVENVMLVSAFLAAAALAQTVGNATGYDQTALLYIEPDTATLAVVDTADGSVADVHREQLPEDDDEAVAKLAEMISRAEDFDEHPDGVVVVGSGVDIPLIKSALEAATSLPVNVLEEPDMALARGAALASANAPLFASSTAARAYAQDPGTGEVDPYVLLPSFLAVPVAPGEQALAYAALPDEEADASTAVAAETGLLTGAFRDISAGRSEQGRKPFLLPGSVLAAVFVVGLVTLVIVLAIAIRPTVNQPPNPGQNLVTPTKQAPAPPALAPAPAPPAPNPAAPLAPAAPAPEAAPAPAPAPPVAPVPAPAPKAPPPAPAPVAPVPAPPLLPGPPPLAPPIIVPLPPIFGPPVPGHGRGHGGIPHIPHF